MKASFDCYCFYEYNLEKKKYILVNILNSRAYHHTEVKNLIRAGLELTQICGHAPQIFGLNQGQEIELEFEF